MNNYNGVGTKINYKKAFYYFQKAAENGNKFAQYNLGNCYKNGEGVEKDANKAFLLYQKSAEQGYKEALFQLGDFYDKGIGIEKDEKKSIYWYQKALIMEMSMPNFILQIVIYSIRKRS